MTALTEAAGPQGPRRLRAVPPTRGDGAAVHDALRPARKSATPRRRSRRRGSFVRRRQLRLDAAPRNEPTKSADLSTAPRAGGERPRRAKPARASSTCSHEAPITRPTAARRARRRRSTPRVRTKSVRRIAHRFRAERAARDARPRRRGSVDGVGSSRAAASRHSTSRARRRRAAARSREPRSSGVYDSHVSRCHARRATWLRGGSTQREQRHHAMQTGRRRAVEALRCRGTAASSGRGRPTRRRRLPRQRRAQRPSRVGVGTTRPPASRLR